MIVVVAPDDLHLARDHRGHFLVYDAQFKPIPPSRQDETLDGLRTAGDQSDAPSVLLARSCRSWRSDAP